MTDREFTLTRTLRAPRELVFRAWTDPAHLDWFFNPGFPTDEPTTVDLRPGGAWRQRMIISEDHTYVTGGIYREIVPVERIVFAWGAVDGWPEIDPDNLAAAPLATVTLVEVDADTTELSLHLVVPDAAWHPAMRDGWSDTVDRLVARFD